MQSIQVPFVDPSNSFIGHYMKVLLEKGSFSAVIERPVHFDTVKMLNRLYMSFVSFFRTRKREVNVKKVWPRK